MLLPGIDPRCVVDRAHAQRADRAQPERLEVPESALGGLDRPLGVGVLGNVRRHDERCGRILARGKLVVRVADEAGRMDRGPGADATEDLGDGFDRFDVGLDAQLEPAHRPRVR